MPPRPCLSCVAAGAFLISNPTNKKRVSLLTSHPHYFLFLMNNPTVSWSNLSIKLTPSNRLHFSIAPVYEFHNQKAVSQKPPKKLPSASVSTPIDYYDSLGFDVSQESDGSYSFPSYLASRPNWNPNTDNTFSLPSLPRPKQFTRLARQTLLDAGGALDKMGFAPNEFHFFTGTLPGSTDAAKEMIARYSREIVHNLKVSLTKRGINLTFNTWEWQKRGALHLHLVIHAPNEDPQQFADYLESRWYDLIDLVSLKSGVSLWERAANLPGNRFWNRNSPQLKGIAAKTVQCEKSVAAYLSKYVGKESVDSGSIPDKRLSSKIKTLFYPSSWWSISNHLRVLIQNFTASLCVRLPSSDASDQFIDWSEFFSSLSSLVLNPFSPKDYPDYVYRSLYLAPDAYFQVKESLESGGFVSSYFSTLTDEHKPSRLALVSVTQSSALSWLRLPENHVHLDKFVNHYLSWYKIKGSPAALIQLIDSSTPLQSSPFESEAQAYFRNLHSASLYSAS